MENEKLISILNELVINNNDRIQRYETATAETDEKELKILFSQFIQTSEHCKAALVAEIMQLGGTPDEVTSMSGKFLKVWMDVKTAFTGKDRKAILNSCEYGEDVAGETYKNVLTNNAAADISEGLQTMLLQQQAMLRADHDRVKGFRDMHVNE